jgi:hypothetical protein
MNDIENNDSNCNSDSTNGNIISLKNFLYYQKPVIGLSETTNSTPIQIIYPMTGEVAIGVPVNDNNSNNNENRSRVLQKVTIASGPEDASIDQFYRTGIVIALGTWLSKSAFASNIS